MTHQANQSNSSEHQAQDQSETQINDNLNDNSGARSADVTIHLHRSVEEARNANEGKSDNASGSVAPSTAEEHVPSSESPEASDLPSAR